MSRHPSWIPARRGEWLLLAALVASYPASLVLPATWAREGGLLENLQVIVLGVGCVLALLAHLRARPAPVAALALWVAPVWLLLAGRELSWGRAWPGVDAMAASAHWIGPLARPSAVLLLAWLLFSAFYHRIDRPLRAALAHRAPWLCLIVTLAGAMGSTCAEGHMSCHLAMAASSAQVFEELCELLAYVALCLMQYVVFAPQMPVQLGPTIAHPVEEAR